MCTSERVQGVQRYLNSAHIKTQPGVVATSKLVPFEIQQTLQSRDEPVYIIRLPVGLRRFPNQFLIYTTFMDKFVMSVKPQSVEGDQTPCQSEPLTSRWVRLQDMLLRTPARCHQCRKAEAQNWGQSVVLACSMSVIRQLNTTSWVFSPAHWTTLPTWRMYPLQPRTELPKD